MVGASADGHVVALAEAVERLYLAMTSVVWTSASVTSARSRTGSARSGCVGRSATRPDPNGRRRPREGLDAADRRAYARGAARGRGAQQLRLPLIDLGSRHLGELEREAHVRAHRHVGIQRVVLEHHRDVAVLRCSIVDQLAANLTSTFEMSSRRRTPIRRAHFQPAQRGRFRARLDSPDGRRLSSGWRHASALGAVAAPRPVPASSSGPRGTSREPCDFHVGRCGHASTSVRD
jgi:hypothetical protein